MEVPEVLEGWAVSVGVIPGEVVLARAQLVMQTLTLARGIPSKSRAGQVGPLGGTTDQRVSRGLRMTKISVSERMSTARTTTGQEIAKLAWTCVRARALAIGHLICAIRARKISVNDGECHGRP